MMNAKRWVALVTAVLLSVASYRIGFQVGANREDERVALDEDHVFHRCLTDAYRAGLAEARQERLVDSNTYDQALFNARQHVDALEIQMWSAKAEACASRRALLDHLARERDSGARPVAAPF